MTRRSALTVICVILALAAAGCTSGNHRSAPNTGASPARASAAVDAAGRPQAASLMLPAGRSSAQYQITAPSPAQYEFNETVIAPASADISVSIRTWYGAIFPSILDSTHDPGCQVRGSEVACFEQFPLLPAQRAGAWTVVVSKHSRPAATVHIAFAFEKP